LILDAIPGIGDYLPGQLLTWGGSLFTLAPQTAWPALATALLLIAAFLAVAILHFQRQEI
jgi:hypothetical protein